MNRMALMILAGAAAAWSQQIDMSSLDKLAAKAKSVNRVNLDGDQLRAFDGEPGSRRIPPGLKSVQVRNFEFDSPGQYSDSDLDAVRRQIEALPGWVKIVESKDGKEHSEIFMCNEPEHKGLAIVSAEPKEVSIVFIKGAVGMRDLNRLHGRMGMPKLDDEDNDDNDKKK